MHLHGEQGGRVGRLHDMQQQQQQQQQQHACTLSCLTQAAPATLTHPHASNIPTIRTCLQVCCHTPRAAAELALALQQWLLVVRGLPPTLPPTAPLRLTQPAP